MTRGQHSQEHTRLSTRLLDLQDFAEDKKAVAEHKQQVAIIPLFLMFQAVKHSGQRKLGGRGWHQSKCHRSRWLDVVACPATRGSPLDFHETDLNEIMLSIIDSSLSWTPLLIIQHLFDSAKPPDPLS